VKTGGNPYNSLDRTNNVIGVFEYVIPSGVSIISGLTQVSGNIYTGGNNFLIQPKPIGRTLIQVRALNNSLCSGNYEKGNLSYIQLDPPELVLKGPNNLSSIDIRCGETDLKTFSVQNGSSNGCITYTWKIANKGWKYNGSIPTSDVVTTTPTIQLSSSDVSTNPPQNVTVEMTSGSETLSSTVIVNYRTPIVNLPFPSSQGFDCSVLDISANLTYPPLNSYSLSWSTQSGYTINGLASPQNTGTTNSAVIQSTNSNCDIIRVTLQASCGNVVSNNLTYCGCLDWSGFSVASYSNGYGMPIRPESIGATLSTQQSDAYEYEWFWYDGNSYTPAGADPSLTFWSSAWPCGYNSLYVRARGYYGVSNLEYVFDYDGYCARMANNNDLIKVYPNPTTSYLNVKYNSKNEFHNIIITDIMGNLKISKKVKSNNLIPYKIDVSEFKKGKYLIVIKDGKRQLTQIFEKE